VGLVACDFPLDSTAYSGLAALSLDRCIGQSAADVYRALSNRGGMLPFQSAQQFGLGFRNRYHIPDHSPGNSRHDVRFRTLHDGPGSSQLVGHANNLLAVRIHIPSGDTALRLLDLVGDPGSSHLAGLAASLRLGSSGSRGRVVQSRAL